MFHILEIKTLSPSSDRGQKWQGDLTPIGKLERVKIIIDIFPLLYIYTENVLITSLIYSIYKYINKIYSLYLRKVLIYLFYDPFTVVYINDSW